MASIWEVIAGGDADELVSALRSNPALANECSPRGMTPLVLATQANNFCAMEIILNCGGSPTMSTSIRSAVSGRLDSGVVPIMFASTKEAIRLLVGAGADVNVTDENGRSVFLRVNALFDSSLAEELIAAGAVPTPEQVKWLAGQASEELKFRESKAQGPLERIAQLRDFIGWTEKWLTSSSSGL